MENGQFCVSCAAYFPAASYQIEDAASPSQTPADAIRQSGLTRLPSELVLSIFAIGGARVRDALRQTAIWLRDIANGATRTLTIKDIRGLAFTTLHPYPLLKILVVDHQAWASLLDGAKAIAASLRAVGTLTSIDLSRNSLALFPASLQTIVDALSEHNRLTSVNLTFNRIGRTPASTQSIADLLRKNSTLTSIDLSFNRIGRDPAGAQTIADALRENGALRLVDLSFNRIGRYAEGAQAMVDALCENSVLTSIDLRCNQFKNADKTALSELARQTGKTVSL